MVALGEKSPAEVDRTETPVAAAPVDSPAPPPAPAPLIPYERGVAVSVRGFRILVALTLVNTVLLGSMVLGPQLVPYASRQWQQWKASREHRRQQKAELAAQQKCLTHALPAATVVYEEDPDEAMKLAKASPKDYAPWLAVARGGPPGWVAPVQRRGPDYFNEYQRGVFGGRVARSDQTLVFLHERTTPAGGKFLVAVTSTTFFGFSPTSGSDLVTFRLEKRRTLTADVSPVGPGAPSSAAKGKVRRRQLKLSLPDHASRVVARVTPNAPLDAPPAIDYGNRLRFYAGQPDPADASRFTIAYEVDGKPGTIDGWLRDEGLELKPREGSLTYDANEGEAWMLPARDAPRGRYD